MENAQEEDPTAVITDAESRKNRIRSSDVDDEKAVPTKMRKMDDGSSANQVQADQIQANQIESDLDLGEEEDYDEGTEQVVELKDADGGEDEGEEPLDLEGDYAGESDQPGADFEEDFEEGDGYDEEEDELVTTADETEDNIGEEADSSTDLQDFVQANLAYIEDCQSDIDSLNQNANEEILRVELKYNKLRLPVYMRRNTYIERVPHFWATVFSQHRQLRQVITKEDIKCLKHIIKLQVEDLEDNRPGYNIQFFFSENPWFENKVITKEYLPWHGSPACSCTPIQWKKGMNLTLKSSSFFSWFTSQEDASADDIAEIIKDDLWPNPLQCFLMSNKSADESDEEEADDSGNLNSKDDSIVLLDDTRDEDDDVEYISSEDEEEQEWQAGRVPATSAQYLIQEDEEDDPEDDEYEGVDEEDDEEEEIDTTGSSSMIQQQQIRKEQERRPKGEEVINIDDDYLGSEEEEDVEYFDGPVDLVGEEKLLQGQAEEDFGEVESSKEPGESPKNLAEDRLTGEVQQSDDSNHDSRHSNGVAGPAEGGPDPPSSTDVPDPPSSTELKTKMQESKVVATPTTTDSDVSAGGT